MRAGASKKTPKCLPIHSICERLKETIPEVETILFFHATTGCDTVFYYSTLAPFSHIRSRERAKYATVLHSKNMHCTAKSMFLRFSGRRTGKTKF